MHPDLSQTDQVTVASSLSKYRMAFCPACRSFQSQNLDKAFRLHSCVPGPIAVSNPSVVPPPSLVCPAIDVIPSSAPAASSEDFVIDPEAPSRVEPAPAPEHLELPVPNEPLLEANEPLPDDYLTLDKAFCTKLTWSDIPSEMSAPFIDFCKNILVAYKIASSGNDLPQMTRQLSHFLLVPQLLLARPRGGPTAISHLRRQIDFAASKYSEQEAYCSATLNSIQQRTLKANLKEPSLMSSQDRDTQHRISNARKFMRLGLLGRAARALLKSKPPLVDQYAIDQLRLLHPPAASLILPPVPHPLFNKVDKDKLARIIKSRLANGSAAGPSGWTGELLAVLIDSNDCLTGLSYIIQDIANNRLEPHARDLLTQSKLFAIPKSETDPTPRPLAIAEPLLKLANLYQLEGLSEPLSALLGPLQEAVCSPSGCEKAIHVLNAALEARSSAVESLPVVLLADASNAFQTVPRVEVLSQLFLNSDLSALHGIASFMYGSPSSLVTLLADNSIERISSEEGVKQGCNLGTILYCIAMQPTFTSAIKDLDVAAKAYADDFSAVGSPVNIAEVINRLANSNYGLNRSKTKVLWPHFVDPPADVVTLFADLGIQIIRNGAPLLGGYITIPGAVQNQAAIDHLRTVVTKHDSMIAAISHPCMRKQDALLLLRYCTVPALAFQARITPLEIGAGPFADFDEKIQECVLKKLLFLEGESLPSLKANIDHFHSASFESILTQIALPLRLGGLGIRSLVASHSQAYWASMAAASNEVDACFEVPQALADSTVQRNRAVTLQSLLALGVPAKAAASLADEPTDVFLPSSTSTSVSEFYKSALSVKSFRLQKILSSAAEDHKLATLLNSFAPAEVRRMESLASLGASAWLTAVPHPDWPSLSIPDDVFRRALRLRLHLPVDSAQFDKCFHCNTSISSPSADLFHFLSCPKRRQAIIHRHDLIVKSITAAANRAGAPSGNEPTSHRLNSNVIRVRPDNYSHFPNGSYVLCDVSVIHAGSPSFRSSSVLGSLRKRAAAKIKKYSTYAAQVRASFTPLVIEVFGALHPDFYEHLKKIRDAALRNTVCRSQDKAAYLARLVQVLSIKLQIGNSWIIDEFVRK